MEACPLELAIPELVTERIRYIINQGGLGPLPEQLEFGQNAVTTGRAILRREPSFVETFSSVKVKNPRDRVGYFTGCLADFRLQSVGRATVEVLAKNGVETVIPKDQVCCGSPLIRTGQVNLVKKNLVEKNIQVFEELGVTTVVSSCPGCTLTWRTNLPEYSREILGRDLNFEVLHTPEYLDRIGLITEGITPLNLKVTYHDSCHVTRGLKIPKRQPRELITQIPGVEFVEMKNSDRCCGAGGGVRAGRRDLSFLIGNRKVPSVEETEADYVAIACPFCEIQFIDLVQRPGIAKVLDLMELLHMAYGLFTEKQWSDWRRESVPSSLNFNHNS